MEDEPATAAARSSPSPGLPWRRLLVGVLVPPVQGAQAEQSPASPMAAGRCGGRRGGAAAEGLGGRRRRQRRGGEGLELAEAGLEAGRERGVVGGGEVGGVELGDLLQRDEVGRLGEDRIDGGQLPATAGVRHDRSPEPAAARRRDQPREGGTQVRE